MAVIFQLSCILLPVLFITIIKALMNKIHENDRDMEGLMHEVMGKLESCDQEDESLLNRLAKLDEQRKRANDALAGNSHVKNQKPFGVYKKNQAYECSRCGAIFVDSDCVDYCPVCGTAFYNSAIHKISMIRYKWLRYWRSRQ